MKKRILVLVALMVFLSAWLPNVSEAAVVSKVVSQAAKQTAKEAAKEIAVDMSFSMVMNYKYTPKDQRKPKEGFEMVCLPKDKKPDNECAAPLQVKKKITRSEIGPVIEQQLEKKIAGGVTATKWGKFLDWFVPVFATGLGVAVIDYAINGDVMGLFDEVAYDSLVELGFIDTLDGQETEPENPGTGGGFVRPSLALPELPIASEGKDWEVLKLKELVNINGLFNCAGVNDCVQIEGVYSPVSKDVSLRVIPKHGGDLMVSSANLQQYSDDFGFKLSGNIIILYQYSTTKYGLDKNNIIQYRVDPQVYSEPSNYISATTGSTSDKKLLRPELYTFAMMNLLRFAQDPVEVSGVTKEPLLFTYIPGSGSIPDEVFVPKFDEAQLQPTRKPGTNMPVIAPGAYPMIETDTGTKVYPYRDADGNIIYKTEDGRVVQDENITVQNPTITEKPDGGITVEKSPTPEDKNPPPGEIPGNPEFPEGESCSASLKKPNFEPLSTAFTTSFPFSIPWDLKRMFDAVFSEIGSNKPEFKYSFDFNGKNYSWNITVPEYFDKWVAFSNSLLLIIFDVGLIYMIYRFTRGGD